MMVGFVGAGRMGGPMVRRLATAGHDVTVLSRTEDRARAIAVLGGRPESDLRIVAAAADVVVVNVFSDDQVRGVCIEGGLLAGMEPGSSLVVHTTGSPSTAALLAARRDDVAIVDAPVSGGPHDVAAGSVTVFVGGDDTAVARVRPMLAAYADPVLHVGGIGTGQAVKLLNNALFAAQVGLIDAVTRVGAHLGIAQKALLEALPHGSSGSKAMEMVLSSGSVDAFVAAVGGFLTKDVATLRHNVSELGVDLGILGAAVEVFGQRPTDPR